MPISQHELRIGLCR